MLQVTPLPRPPMQSARRGPAADQRLGIGELMGFVRRYSGLIGICVLAALAIGALYVMTATRVYVAQAQVFIEPKRSKAVNGVTEFGLLQLDSAQLENQIQVVKSALISGHVVRELRLMDDPEFGAPAPSFLEHLKRIFGSDAGSPEAADQMTAETAVISRFNERLSVRRVGQSYVIEIAFWSQSAQTAARVANAVTAAYIRDQIVARLDAAQRGAEILEVRISDLRGQLATLEATVRSGVIHLESFPIADGRVITSASLPLGPSWPKSSLVLVLAALVGTFVGGVSAALRHATDQRVRSRQQIENDLHVTFLGMLPKLRHPPKGGIFTHMYSHPQSSFSNDLRSIKAEIDIARLDTKFQCIGIVSVFPGEGKSTVASNLAYAFSAAGRRTLLMDCDIRTRALSSSLAASSRHGLLEVIAGTNRIEQALLANEKSGFALLPIVATNPIANFSDFLGSDGMCRILQYVRQSYAVVLIDLPAITSGADARAISPFLDAIIVVAEFNATPSDALGAAIELLDRPQAKVLGVVLNKFKK